MISSTHTGLTYAEYTMQPIAKTVAAIVAATVSTTKQL